MKRAEMQELIEYTVWANARVLAAAEALTAEELTRDLKSSFPSVRDTLVHIMGGEWVWLTRWQGGSPTAMPEPGRVPAGAPGRAGRERLKESLRRGGGHGTVERPTAVPPH